MIHQGEAEEEKHQMEAKATIAHQMEATGATIDHHQDQVVVMVKPWHQREAKEATIDHQMEATEATTDHHQHEGVVMVKPDHQKKAKEALAEAMERKN
jgi:hypothetical protein